MSKKTRKNYKENGRMHKSGNVVHPGFMDDTAWHPLDDEIERGRDKSYVKTVRPRTDGQRELMEAIAAHNLTVAIGPAGTGKTYLAICAAVEALEKGKVDKIILSRPAMEAGESLGFLPGDMHEKMAPYLRPLYDALGDRLGGKKVRQYMDEGTIEIAPVVLYLIKEILGRERRDELRKADSIRVFASAVKNFLAAAKNRSRLKLGRGAPVIFQRHDSRLKRNAWIPSHYQKEVFWDFWPPRRWDLPL